MLMTRAMLLAYYPELGLSAVYRNEGVLTGAGALRQAFTHPVFLWRQQGTHVVEGRLLGQEQQILAEQQPPPPLKGFHGMLGMPSWYDMCRFIASTNRP